MLAENEKIKLSDYKNDVIILSFVAEWAKPAQITIIALNKLYDENLTNVRIIAVSTENDKDEVSGFRKFVKLLNIKFQTGWADEIFIDKFFEISRFKGVPQSFIIKNGKFRGVFVGGGLQVNKQMVELVRKISAEEL